MQIPRMEIRLALNHRPKQRDESQPPRNSLGRSSEFPIFSPRLNIDIPVIASTDGLSWPIRAAPAAWGLIIGIIGVLKCGDFHPGDFRSGDFPSTPARGPACGQPADPEIPRIHTPALAAPIMADLYGCPGL